MSQINILRSPYRSESHRSQSFNLKRKFQNTMVEKVAHFDLNPTLVVLVLLVMSILLSCIYLIQFNKVATKGYELKKLEVTQQELNSQSEVKNLYLARAKSMSNIMQSDRLTAMRKPKEMN